MSTIRVERHVEVVSRSPSAAGNAPQYTAQVYTSGKPPGKRDRNRRVVKRTTESWWESKTLLSRRHLQPPPNQAVDNATQKPHERPGWKAKKFLVKRNDTSNQDNRQYPLTGKERLEKWWKGSASEQRHNHSGEQLTKDTSSQSFGDGRTTQGHGKKYYQARNGEYVRNRLVKRCLTDRGPVQLLDTDYQQACVTSRDGRKVLHKRRLNLEEAAISHEASDADSTELQLQQPELQLQQPEPTRPWLTVPVNSFDEEEYQPTRSPSSTGTFSRSSQSSRASIQSATRTLRHTQGDPTGTPRRTIWDSPKLVKNISTGRPEYSSYPPCVVKSRVASLHNAETRTESSGSRSSFKTVGSIQSDRIMAE